MPTLLIMAAGIGSRYGGLKQIDPVGPNNEIIIDYSIHDATRAGFDKAVFVIRRDMEKAFREEIIKRYESAIDCSLVFQEIDSCLGGFDAPPHRTKPWGTGHAVLVTADRINEPFAVINADDYYGPRSFEILADFGMRNDEGGPDRYAMVGYLLRNTLSDHGYVSRGVCTHDDAMRLKNIVERTHVVKSDPGAYFLDDEENKKPLTGEELVSMNLWGFGPSIFEHLENRFRAFLAERGNDPKAEFYIPTVVDALIEEGSAVVDILPTDDVWFGVTYKEDRAVARDRINRLIAEGVYPEKLNHGP